jgi:hypothetical protein
VPFEGQDRRRKLCRAARAQLVRIVQMLTKLMRQFEP